MISTTLNKICSNFMLNYTSIKQPINVGPLVHAVQNIPFYVLSRLFRKCFYEITKIFPAFVSIYAVYSYTYFYMSMNLYISIVIFLLGYSVCMS